MNDVPAGMATGAPSVNDEPNLVDETKPLLNDAQLEARRLLDVDEIPPDDGSVRIKLAKKIQAYAETVEVLKFKKPNVNDMLVVGANPFTFDPISETPRLLPEAAALN